MFSCYEPLIPKVISQVAKIDARIAEGAEMRFETENYFSIFNDNVASLVCVCVLIIIFFKTSVIDFNNMWGFVLMTIKTSVCIYHLLSLVVLLLTTCWFWVQIWYNCVIYSFHILQFSIIFHVFFLCDIFYIFLNHGDLDSKDSLVSIKFHINVLQVCMVVVI